MRLLLLFYASTALAADPNCKFAAFKAANPIPPSNIQMQASTECMNQLQMYSNYLGFGRTPSNECSDWNWADRLHQSYGSRIRSSGILFDEIPDLDNPLGKPVATREVFRLKLRSTNQGYTAEITAVIPSGARCALTVDIARPAGVPAPVVASAATRTPPKAKAPKKKKKSRGRR